TIDPIRRATVYAQAELLDLVGEPIDDDVFGSVIALEGRLAELPVDRLLVVEGERTDLDGASGIRWTEVVRVAGTTSELTNPRDPHEPPSDDGGKITTGGVKHAPPPPRAQPYTTVLLATPLKYRYKRASVQIRGNVIAATHGETKDEVLGSGDATVPDH